MEVEFSSPIDFIYTTMLAIAAGAMGRSVAVTIKPGWTEPCNLFCALVGKKGAIKSPPIKYLSRPLVDIQADLLADHRRECAEIRERDGKKAEYPRPRQILLSDATVEAMIQILQDNPRGVITIRDELSGLFTGLNQYKGGTGSDRQNWLNFFSGEMAKSDRKTPRPDQSTLFVPHPCVSLIGGVTPDMLTAFLEKQRREDGFLDRFLFAYPPPFPYDCSLEGLDPKLSTHWEQMIQMLYNRPMVPHGLDVRPAFVEVVPEIGARFKEWSNRCAKDADADTAPDDADGLESKLRKYVFRLALILDRMDREDGDYHRGLPAIPIGAFEGAIRLCDYYRDNSYRVNHTLKSGQVDSPDGRRVLRWIVDKRLTTFTDSDLRRNFPQRFPIDGPARTNVTRWLMQRHCIRPAYQPEREGPGRKPSLAWEVNPKLLIPAPAETQS
jgi:hypothetical protein